MINLDADKLYSENISHINIGCGEEVSINELALLIQDIVGFEGELVFNTNYPDGMPRKLLNIDKINNLGWESSISLKDGIRDTYNWFINNYT